MPASLIAIVSRIRSLRLILNFGRQFTRMFAISRLFIALGNSRNLHVERLYRLAHIERDVYKNEHVQVKPTQGRDVSRSVKPPVNRTALCRVVANLRAVPKSDSKERDHG